MENKHDWLGILAFIISVCCTFAVADQRDQLKQEAVKRGFAEWVPICENNTEFRWKEK